MEISFGKGSFNNHLWLNSGSAVNHPVNVNVESVNAGAFALEVVSTDGTVVASNTTANKHGGWTGWNLPSLGVHNGVYKLRFVNKDKGTREIKQGTIETQ